MGATDIVPDGTEDGGGHWPVGRLDVASEQAAEETPNMFLLATLCATAAVGFVAVLIMTVFAVKRCNQRRHKSEYWDIDSELGIPPGSKSAPSTRPPTPRMDKKRSKSRDETKRDKLEHSHAVTMTPLPFNPQPERVQPRSPNERKTNENVFQYQVNRMAAIQPDINRSFEDDADPPSPTNHGRLYFSFFYNVNLQELVITLVKAKYLKGREKPTGGARDPFVKVFLLPDERTVHQSRTIKNTNYPVFNETFPFKVAEAEVPERTLRMSVYDVDKRRVRHCLGHVVLPLKEVDIWNTDVQWRELDELSQKVTGLGEINVTLEYSSSEEKIWMVIEKLRNMKKENLQEGEGVFVKAQLMQCGHTAVKCKKTATVPNSNVEPNFQESLRFDIDGKQLESYSFIISVMVTSLSPGNRRYDNEYGRVTIGPYLFARGDKLQHWQDAVSQPRVPVTMWHQLSPPVPLPQQP